MEAGPHICRVCLEPQNSDEYKFLDDEYEGGDIYIRDMLQLCIPEMDSYVSPNPVICLPCLRNLAESYNFKHKCMGTENRIRDFMIQNNLLNYAYVNLHNVVASTNPPPMTFDPNGIMIFKPIPDNNVTVLNGFMNGPPIPQINSLVKCKFCMFTTTSQGLLNKHICPNRPIYNCNQCTFITSEQAMLRVHVTQFHKRDNWHYCPQCQYSTADAEDLRIHKLEVHNQELLKQLKCPKCPYIAIHDHLLRRHIAKHDNNFILKCEHCSYETRDKSNFKKHKFIHVKNKPVKCNLCPFSCVSPYQVRKHLRKFHNKAEPTPDLYTEAESNEESSNWVGHATY